MTPDPPSAPPPKSSSAPAGKSDSSSHPKFLHGAEGFTPEIASAPPAYQPLAVPPGPQTVFRQKTDGWMASLQSLAVTVVIALFVITFLLQAFQIPSESMEDTLLIGDYLLVNKVDFGDGGFWRRILPYRRVERGDIIVFKYPVNPSQHFVKRVIALPGDRVRLLNKQVWINGKP
jgi:signal peptidase I